MFLHSQELFIAIIFDYLGKEAHGVVLVLVLAHTVEEDDGPLDDERPESVLLIQVCEHVLLHRLSRHPTFQALLVKFDFLHLDIVDKLPKLLEGQQPLLLSQLPDRPMQIRLLVPHLLESDPLDMLFLLPPLLLALLHLLFHPLIDPLFALGNKLLLLHLQNVSPHLIDRANVLLVDGQFLAVLVLIVVSSLAHLLKRLEEIVVLDLLVVHIDRLVRDLGGHGEVKFIDFFEGRVDDG